MNGNGCAGSTAIGVSTGNRLLVEALPQPLAIALGQLAHIEDGHALIAQRAVSSCQQRCCTRDHADPLLDRRSCCVGVMPSWPTGGIAGRATSISPATRTM